MARTPRERSQVFDLIFGLAEHHGFTTNEAQANIFGVTTATISNWRAGRVRGLNRSSLEEVIARLHFLSRRRGVDLVSEPSLCPIVIEEGAGPDDLERQLRDRWDSIYLGHKFLYYHPAGAIAWTQLLATGYGHEAMVRGFEQAFAAALDHDQNRRGALASLLHWPEGRSAGIDVIALGPGEGRKEAAAVKLLMTRAGANQQLIDWLTYTPVDVSIPLLRLASELVRTAIREAVEVDRWPHFLVRPSCSDFEDGNMGFASHLSDSADDRRLILLLGGTFGNLRSERVFVEKTLNAIVRPGDGVWIEVGPRMAKIEDEPLYRFTRESSGDAQEDAQDTFRRMLVEGPHRRFGASVGLPIDTKMRISTDEVRTCEIPRSYNFVHDVELSSSGRRCSVLYSRRYDIAALRQWFAGFGYSTQFEHVVQDRHERAWTVHLLLRRDRG